MAKQLITNKAGLQLKIAINVLVFTWHTPEAATLPPTEAAAALRTPLPAPYFTLGPEPRILCNKSVVSNVQTTHHHHNY